MDWAFHHVAKLKLGETVQFRPRGNSMLPKIRSGQLVTVEPFTGTNAPIEGDVVLCRVRGGHLLHLVTATKDGRYQISNNKGHVNGWVTLEHIYGKCIKVAQ